MEYAALFLCNSWSAYMNLNSQNVLSVAKFHIRFKDMIVEMIFDTFYLIIWLNRVFLEDLVFGRWRTQRARVNSNFTKFPESPCNIK